jgi:exonuclease VII small subunit
MNPEFEKLHQSIDARLAELKRHLGDLAMEGEFQKLQAVTEQAKELEQGKDLLRRAERCLVGAERKLEALLRSNHTKAPLTILRVTVSWPRLGVIGPDEVIEERTAADTLQRLFERLAQKVGNHILERAADVIYGDRPVLSRRRKNGSIRTRVSPTPPGISERLAGTSSPIAPPSRKLN